MRIETICKGGVGSKAEVFVQLRNEFPGFGGNVITEQDFVVAYRIPFGAGDIEDNSNRDELNLDTLLSVEALNTFLRHALIKKLDDYFFRKGDYRFAHVPRPLGSTDKGAYIYEWVYGTEGFNTEYFDMEYSRMMPIHIDEWNTVSGRFNSAGISIFHDIADADDGRHTKNVIIQEPALPAVYEEITKLWKRIDFGLESLPVNLNQFKKFMKKNRVDLIKFLGDERVEMMELTEKYLSGNKNIKDFSEYNRLNELVKSFRVSTASHMGIEALNSSRELERYTVQEISTNSTEELNKPSFSRNVESNEKTSMDLEIRSSFPCIDGTIYTMQEIPVAKYTKKESSPEQHLELFLRHFVIKKIEDAFISQKRYNLAHIPRPLGFDETSYYYEWVYGKSNCPKDLLDRDAPSNRQEGLDDWYEFTSFFKEAGIDFKSNLIYFNENATEYASHIIVRQPSTLNPQRYISRMWRRINFDEDFTPINISQLATYLVNNENDLREHLNPGRYETMKLAVKYLDEQNMSFIENARLVRGIHSYRVSALRHLNHHGFERQDGSFIDLKYNI